MRALGVSEEVIEKSKAETSAEVREIEENGNTFKITVTTATHKISNTFVIGQECELDTLTGDKIKAVIQRDGNKLHTSMMGIDSLTELVDSNTMVETLTLGNIKSKRTFKRV